MAKKIVLGGEKSPTTEIRSKYYQRLLKESEYLPKQAAELLARAPKIKALAERLKAAKTQPEIEAIWRETNEMDYNLLDRDYFLDLRDICYFCKKRYVGGNGWINTSGDWVLKSFTERLDFYSQT